MKHIRKAQEEPENFHRWKKLNKGANWEAFSKTSEHRELGSQLVEEQQGMCCYCEISISPEKAHIEHLKPKGNPLKQS